MDTHHIVIVEGRGAFPLDMLRYDSLTFLTPEDEEIAAKRGRRAIRLTTTYRRPLVWQARVARWESFSWHVAHQFKVDAPAKSDEPRLTPEIGFIPKKPEPDPRGPVAPTPNNLVTRLRSEAREHDGNGFFKSTSRVMREAADEITRLRVRSSAVAAELNDLCVFLESGPMTAVIRQQVEKARALLAKLGEGGQ